MSNEKLRFRYYAVPVGVSLSAVLPASASRCGIYVLHFADGSRYVGQALNVLTRFAAHRRHFEVGIEGLDFAPATRARLTDLERRTIQRLERDGIELVNSAGVGMSRGESPLDLVIDRVAQERWLDGVSDDDYDFTERLAASRRRQRTGEKFAKLSAHADYPGIRLVLCTYLALVVPWPHETEGRFWSLTCLPSTNRSAVQHRLSAISVNNVETLVIAELLDPDGDWLVGGFINVAPGIVKRRGLRVKPHSYGTTGELDRIDFADWSGLLNLLVDRPDVVGAAKLTALGLMRKGRGMMARYHDQSLADDLFELMGTDEAVSI